MIRLMIFTLACITSQTAIGQDVVKQNPKITYEVGWWVYQGGLKLISAQVEKVPNGLGPSWLHPKGEVIITIEGEIVGRNGWMPLVSELHISQQKPSEVAEASILVTPVVDLKSRSSYHGETIKFQVTKHLPLSMMNWGPNLYRFQIGQFTSQITFQQSK